MNETGSAFSLSLLGNKVHAHKQVRGHPRDTTKFGACVYVYKFLGSIPARIIHTCRYTLRARAYRLTCRVFQLREALRGNGKAILPIYVSRVFGVEIFQSLFLSFYDGYTSEVFLRGIVTS